MARITEARLRREVSEGKIVDFRRSDGGFDVIRKEAMNRQETKVRVELIKTSMHKAVRRDVTFEMLLQWIRPGTRLLFLHEIAVPISQSLLHS